MHVAVENPAIFGKKLSDILHEFNGEYVVSRIMKGKEILFATGDIVLEEGDKVLIVTSQQEVEKLRILFGQEVPMHLEDWDRMDHHLVTRRLTVTKSSLTGKKLRDLHFREAVGAVYAGAYRFACVCLRVCVERGVLRCVYDVVAVHVLVLVFVGNLFESSVSVCECGVVSRRRSLRLLLLGVDALRGFLGVLQALLCGFLLGEVAHAPFPDSGVVAFIGVLCLVGEVEVEYLDEACGVCCSVVAHQGVVFLLGQ